jgi:Glycosyl hydrolases family 43
VGEPHRGRRRRWLLLAASVLCAGAIVVAVWTDVDAHTSARQEAEALRAAQAHLDSLHRDVTTTEQDREQTTARRDGLQASITQTLGQLASVNTSLQTTSVHAYFQGLNISTLQTCLGGVQNALAQIKAQNNDRAAQDISAVSGPCTQLAGGAGDGLVYPFDFPDPDVILVGHTFFAYATNSVAGNIQIIQSGDLTHWTVVGNALPKLPGWATAHYTWSPAVAQVGGAFALYYAVDVAGSASECISVATATQPQGPFIDNSSGPLECQKSLGGSIDPSPFIDTNGTPYLVWKSGGPGSSAIWSQPLTPAGTAFVAGTNPTVLLTPGQPWEGGTVEAPDLVAAGGRDELFFSGNDWNSADYAIGVAACNGPLGPCTDASTAPVLSSGSNVAGPGGESVFADSAGAFHIAFHAWVPGAVGFPNSRDLYVRPLSLAGASPVVGSGS